jgi:hypothetical protein
MKVCGGVNPVEPFLFDRTTGIGATSLFTMISAKVRSTTQSSRSPSPPGRSLEGHEEAFPAAKFLTETDYSSMSCAQWESRSGLTGYSVVIPAQAGIYLSTAPFAEQWAPAFAGATNKLLKVGRIIFGRALRGRCRI